VMTRESGHCPPDHAPTFTPVATSFPQHTSRANYAGLNSAVVLLIYPTSILESTDDIVLADPFQPLSTIQRSPIPVVLRSNLCAKATAINHAHPHLDDRERRRSRIWRERHSLLGGLSLPCSRTWSSLRDKLLQDLSQWHIRAWLKWLGRGSNAHIVRSVSLQPPSANRHPE
jgi:hypothetical protein